MKVGMASIMVRPFEQGDLASVGRVHALSALCLQTEAGARLQTDARPVAARSLRSMTGQATERPTTSAPGRAMSRRLSPYLDLALGAGRAAMSVAVPGRHRRRQRSTPGSSPPTPSRSSRPLVAGLSLVWRRTRPVASFAVFVAGLSRRHPDRPLHRAAVGAAAVQPLLAGGARRATPARRARPGRRACVVFIGLALLDVPDLGTLRPAAGLRAAPDGVGARRRDPVAPRPAGRAAAGGRAGGGHRARAGRPRRRRGAAADRPGAARRRRAQHVPDRRAGRRRRARHPHRRGRRRARARGHRRDQPQGADPDPVDARAAPRRGRRPTGPPLQSHRRPRRPRGTTCSEAGVDVSLTIEGTPRPLERERRADRLPDRAGVPDQRAQALRRHACRRRAWATSRTVVDIEVRDRRHPEGASASSGPAPGGHGLVGLRERSPAARRRPRVRRSRRTASACTPTSPPMPWTAP